MPDRRHRSKRATVKTAFFKKNNKMKFRSHIPGALAASIIFLFLPIPAASAQQPATRRYKTKFEVSITKRADVLLPPYQVIGDLGMDVASDGSFSCEIAPLKGLADLPDPQSVVFIAGKFDPDGPAKLPCSGQVMGPSHRHNRRYLRQLQDIRHGSPASRFQPSRA